MIKNTVISASLLTPNEPMFLGLVDMKGGIKIESQSLGAFCVENAISNTVLT